jgi:CopA family copper-resistance protein
MNLNPPPFSRRNFVRATTVLGLWAGLGRLVPAYAQTLGHAGYVPGRLPAQDNSSAETALTISEEGLLFGDRRGQAIAVNGIVPGPLLRFREGQNAVIRVTNRLKDDASIHWHGVLLPQPMDGVPGVSFKGIEHGATFTYQFPIKQYGTYWYHSHSGFQEQLGLYGPLIFDPAGPDPFAYEREHVVILSDWTFCNPGVLLAKLKKDASFSNYQRQTLGDFFRDAEKRGWRATLADRREWAKMRMDPTDFADITGAHYTYLTNGRAPEGNWTGLFRPGERVRLRFINAAAMTHFDVRIPGLSMNVIQADGQNIQPVRVEEFRIAPAETYDVIVEPTEDRAYTIFSETMDRSGYTRATLAPRDGMEAPIPVRRPRPLRTMKDMGMGEMAGMDKGGAKAAAPSSDMAGMPDMKQDAGGMAGMNPSATPAPASTDAAMGGMRPTGHEGMAMGTPPAPAAAMAGMGAMPTSNDMGTPPVGVPAPVPDFGPGNSMTAMSPSNRLNDPGTGLEASGTRVLLYSELRSHLPRLVVAPSREIVLHLTGNMDKYIWGFDGQKYSEAEPIRLQHNERVRLTFINDTMMDHPLHLHGMFMELENGADGFLPHKHTVNVKAGEKVSVLVTADALGNWAFHCHLFYHMEAGMFRVVSVA